MYNISEAAKETGIEATNQLIAMGLIK